MALMSPTSFSNASFVRITPTKVSRRWSDPRSEGDDRLDGPADGGTDGGFLLAASAICAIVAGLGARLLSGLAVASS